ncbi:MAG: vitamin B12 dependent-methionine synthase activation domain-containing protein [bacterium]
MKSSASSLYQAIELDQEIKPLMIGERCNSNGSKRFRECLLADDFDGCLRIALEQEKNGAHLLDVCAAYAGRDELADLTRLVSMFTESVKIPLVIDSTTPDCIEAVLKQYPGRCVINSINLEDGGMNLHRVCRLLKKYGAAAIALTINEKGMAMTADEKVETAKKIYQLAVEEHGLRPWDLLFDPLTFTIGSGDESLRDAAIQTLEAIRRIKAELPGVFTVLGLSNISFGLPPHARRILNSVFVHEAVEAGLDAAIIDVAKIMPLNSISEEDREISLDLLYDRSPDGEDKKPLTRFIEHFQDRSADDDDSQSEESLRTEQLLSQKVVNGDKDALIDTLQILMQRYTPIAIINQILVPSMRHVGELFGRGEILLPFVLQSAEVMKMAVSHLEPYMEKIEGEGQTKILLATVQGDVHDIGKNLVDIILSNNGYKVYNIGTKVPAETIIQKAREYKVDLVGLSGLLVKSAIVMKESMSQYRDAGLGVPILLGGAALTPKFVAQDCVPGYDQPVVYCPDAFAGLRAVKEYEAGQLKATEWSSKAAPKAMKPGRQDQEIDRSIEVPEPPFIGCRHVMDIDPAKIFPYVNEQALFRGRWGYRRGKMGADEYAELVKTKVEPMYADMKRRSIEEGLIQPKAAYGYFKCYAEGDSVIIEDGDQAYSFTFPRQEEAPHLCISDYFKTKEEGGDVAAFFVVTIGEEISKHTKELFESDSYHDYLMLHGFSVEVTDALAEYWHEEMRREMGITEDEPDAITGYVTQEYRGSRYGFGYPACPDLDAHEAVFALLDPAKIGVSLTENMEMVPEQSTSAIIAHHPQAKYFAV